MNVKLKVLSAGVLFFLGAQTATAQRTEVDTTKTRNIEEIVVLGYSKTSTKAKSTAAVTTVSAETLENRPNATFLNSLQGAAPGITINSASGSPGSGKIEVLVRGLSSLNGSTDPLYVIDGIATSSSQFRNLNPNDIESISILRDAQATSIYGNRAAAGVVVITTKTTRYNSKLRLSYDALTSFSTYPKTKYNPANAKQFLQIQHNYDRGLGGSMTQEEIDEYAINTDWNHEFFRVGMSQQHNLALQTGGQNVSLYSSLGYTKNEGSIKGTDFQRFTFRNNLMGKTSNNRFTYSANIGLGYSKRSQLDQEENSGINANSIQNVLFGGILSNPTLAPYPYKNGTEMFAAIGTAVSAYRPYVLYDNMIGGVQNKYTEFNTTANVNFSYKLLDWLTAGNKTGMDFKESDRDFARSPWGYLSNSVAYSAGAKYGGAETQTNVKDLTFNSITNLTANQSFGDHNFNLGVYLDYLKAHYLYKAYTQNGLDPLTWALGAGTGYIPFNPDTPNLYRPTVGASKINAGTLAYFATLDYDYAGRYGLGAVVRRDGSYRFPKENRWETFWSVAGRWNIDKESFMEDSNFRMLKLRASYGTQGNQNLGVAVNNFNPLFLNPAVYVDSDALVVGYQSLPGYAFSNLGNPDLRWEKVEQGNIGLDLNYRNLIEASIDVYQKTTSRMFNDINFSAITGLYSITGNNGKMQNKGIEGSLKVNALNNENIKLSVFGNAAYNKNKILELADQNLTDDNVLAVGGVAYQWHLVRYVGVNPETGEQQFLDANGNITEEPTANDRILTGKSIYPKVTGGFGLNADYRGFFASAAFSFQAGAWSYDNLYAWMMDPNYAASGLNVSADLLNSWTPNNHTNIPNMDAYNLGTEGSSDRFLYKTDFIKLKNVSVGYSFTKNQLEGLPISGLKLFAQAENLYTWTKWKGFDPEPRALYSLGVYPNPKTVSVGFNVEF